MEEKNMSENLKQAILKVKEMPEVQEKLTKAETLEEVYEIMQSAGSGFTLDEFKAAMEEMNKANDDFDASSINAVKAALMGPLSGIGDSLILGTLRVLAVGIGTSLAVKGNILGPILFFLIFNIPTFILRYVCAIKGYELGANYLEKVQASGLMEKFMLAAAILGVMVIGGMTNELVVAKTALKIGSGKSATEIQSVLDGIMPGLLPLAATGIYYKLLQKKTNVILMIVGTAIFGIICAQFGILAA